MNQEIKNINLIFEDGETVQLDENLFTNFYIANIDNKANEIPYEKLLNTNILYANFLTLKINNLINNYYNEDIIKKVYNKKNLAEIKISTSNGKEILFNVASSIDPFKKNINNYYDKSFIEEDNLCLLISQYEIKYKNHLFV